jgi:prolyl 4-hydroxylase
MIFILVIAALCLLLVITIFLIRRQINLRTVENFLSEEECQYFIARASFYLENQIQSMAKNFSRTSTPVYLQSDDDVIISVRLRAANYLNVPEGYIEKLQVVRYTVTQEYVVHHDWFQGGKAYTDGHPDGFDVPYQRQTTILVYLNDVARGGETFFPYLRKKITPKCGTAVCWNNLWPNGRGNALTLHAGLPVAKGIKWAVNIWVADRDVDQAKANARKKLEAVKTRSDNPL